MTGLEELREARLTLLNAEIEAKQNEARFARIKADEAEREYGMTSASVTNDNILLFSLAITEETVAHAIRTLEMYSRRQPGCDITICLNTNGGEMIAGFYLYDYLQELRSRGHHLTVKVFGGAFSHGVTILQAADRRVISENATLLIHEAQLEELSGNYSQIFKQGKGRLDKYQDKLLTILAARSTMSKARIKNRWSNNDWTLTAEEALKYGFVDEIQSAPSFG